MAACADQPHIFNYQEQFSVINDEKFLSRVEKQYLQLEVWRDTRTDGNGNGNTNNKRLQPIGIVRLPLHQFFIAYRDSAITNHLCKGKMPVISIDTWAQIVNCRSGNTVGELKCLLAIGSEEQIANLKQQRDLKPQAAANAAVSSPIVNTLRASSALILLPSTGQSMRPKVLGKPSEHARGTSSRAAPQSNVQRKASDLLATIQHLLVDTKNAKDAPAGAPPPPLAMSLPVHALVPAKSSARFRPSTNTGSSSMGAASAKGAVGPFKLIQPKNTKSFHFALDIQRATNLPRNPAAKGKKNARRNTASAASKRFPANEAPSAYVTFQAEDGGQQAKAYKSHEGMVYATDIVERCTEPQWRQHFRVEVGIDYLMNPQKRFILKVWKKAATQHSASAANVGERLPTPREDAIIGFAALNLNMLLRGFDISGLFNIVDFCGRVNGQLELRCQPLENLQRIVQQPPAAAAATAAASVAEPVHVPSTDAAANTPAAATSTETAATTSTAAPPAVVLDDAVIDQFESSLDLTHLNLNQSIKRKFAELEEISERLRVRLADVTGEPQRSPFDIATLDNWEPLEHVMLAEGNECDIDEFERDIACEMWRTPPASPTSSINAAQQQQQKEEKHPVDVVDVVELPPATFES